MTEARSKRRVLPLVFIVKSFTKSLLIKTMTATKYFVDNGRVQSLFMCLEVSKLTKGVNTANRASVRILVNDWIQIVQGIFHAVMSVFHPF